MSSTIPSQFSNDLHTHVFSFLDEKSLVNAGKVCKRWNRLINHHEYNDKLLWKSLFERCYNYTPTIEPPFTFREAYGKRHRLIKNLQKSAPPERSLQLPSHMSITNCVATTHFLLVTASNDSLSFINGTLYCFDRITDKEVALFPVSPERYSEPYINLLATDIVAVRFDASFVNSGESQVFDVSDKSQVSLLFTTKKMLFIPDARTTSQEKIIYTDAEQRICTYDIHTKTARTLKTTIDESAITYSTSSYNKLALFTDTKVIVIDMVNDCELCSATHSEIGLTLSEELLFRPPFPSLGSKALSFLTKNDNLLIRLSGTQFGAFDINTKKSREISLPLTPNNIRVNEQFLVIKEPDGIYFWNRDDFIDAPQKILDTPDNKLQLIEGEKLLTVSNKTGTAKIWNLKTMLPEMTHSLVPNPMTSTGNFTYPICTYPSKEGIVWVHFHDCTPAISLFIDMKKAAVISEKQRPNCPSARHPFFDATSYGFVDNQAIKVFDPAAATNSPPAAPPPTSVTPLSFVADGITSTIKYLFGW